MIKLFLIFFLLFTPLNSFTQTQQVTVNQIGSKIVYDNDKSANNKEYFGWAKIGIATSAAKWKIMRITYVGDDFTVEWADGNQLYDNVWDNRTSLTYK